MSITIPARPLTAEAFSPFGEVIEISGAPTTMINRGMCGRWHDLAATEVVGEGARIGVSMTRSEPYALPLMLDLVERHPLGSQIFMPLSGRPFLVVVCPDAGGTPGRPEAFVATGSQGVNYRRNTWHAVLTPLGERADFLVVDRVTGDGVNLEEHTFAVPYLITADGLV